MGTFTMPKRRVQLTYIPPYVAGWWLYSNPRERACSELGPKCHVSATRGTSSTLHFGFDYMHVADGKVPTHDWQGNSMHVYMQILLHTVIYNIYGMCQCVNQV